MEVQLENKPLGGWINDGPHGGSEWGGRQWIPALETLSIKKRKRKVWIVSTPGSQTNLGYITKAVHFQSVWYWIYLKYLPSRKIFSNRLSEGFDLGNVPKTTKFVVDPLVNINWICRVLWRKRNPSVLRGLSIRSLNLSVICLFYLIKNIASPWLLIRGQEYLILTPALYSSFY